jgi:hypothetical protein
MLKALKLSPDRLLVFVPVAQLLSVSVILAILFYFLPAAHKAH